MVPVALGTWLLRLFLPAIDPRRRAYGQFAPTYRLVRAVPIVLLLVVDAATLLGALGHPVDPRAVTDLVVAALLLVLRNLLPRVRPTWFAGVRTPWTLSSDEVWRRTHRLAGRLFVASAVLPLLAVLADRREVPLAVLAAVLAPTAVATGYSWWLYGRIGSGAGP